MSEPAPFPIRALWIGAIAFLLASAGCANRTGVREPEITNPGSKKLAHVVLFWFQDGTPPEVIDELADLYTSRVHAVPGVDQVVVGRPAFTPRPVVDNSYDLLTILRFRDGEAAEAWQSHPVHLELKARFDARLASVQVYDAVE